MPFNFGSAANFSAEHPFACAAMGVGLLAVAAPGIVAAPVLCAVGFGGLGPIAGTAAACVQSGIGNVVAGSAFATLQSAAMGGAGAAVVNGAVAAAAGGVVAAVGAVSTTYSKGGKDGGDGDGAEDGEERDERKRAEKEREDGEREDGERDDGVEKA